MVENKKEEIVEVDPVDVIFGFLIEGNSNADILGYLATIDISPETASAYLQEAFQKLIKAQGLPNSVRKGWCLEAMRELYRRMLASGDYSGALRAVQEISKLSGADKSGSVAPEINPGVADDVDAYIDSVMAV